MKLFVLIVLTVLLSGILFFLHEILPEKTSRVLLIVLIFIAFIIMLFGGAVGILRLGQLWGMEHQAKLILGIAFNLTIFAVLVYGWLKK